MSIRDGILLVDETKVGLNAKLEKWRKAFEQEGLKQVGLEQIQLI